MKNYIKLISELILDWNTIQSKCANLQELATKSIEAITVTADKHAPKNIFVGLNKKKKFTKLWITK